MRCLFAGQQIVADSERQLQQHRGTQAGTAALGAHAAPVLPGNGSDQEQTQPRALDLNQVVRGSAVEAVEDALELAGWNPQAGI